jgi:hypothetical protein
LSKKKTPFRWTVPRQEVADLVAQGKSFMEIVAEGYSNTMTSMVMNELNRAKRAAKAIEDETAEEPEDGVKAKEEGTEEKEEEKEKEKADKKDKKNGETPEKVRALIGTAGPKTSPILFRLGQKEIVLDPMELHNQYRYYLDLARRNGGITETFSEVLTLGMQVLWVLHQDIPMSENMLKAIFSK